MLSLNKITAASLCFSLLCSGLLGVSKLKQRQKQMNLLIIPKEDSVTKIEEITKIEEPTKIEKIAEAADFSNLRTWTEYCFRNLPEYVDAIYSLEKDNQDNSLPILKNIVEENRSPFTGQINVFKTVLDSVTKKIQESLNQATNWESKKKNLKAYVQKIKIDPGHVVGICGDIHGSLHSLLRNLWNLFVLGYLKEDYKIKENFILVFLGDLVNRGFYSLEVLYTILKLKQENPDNVFILTGNHEADHENVLFSQGFDDECQTKNVNSLATKIKAELFSFLPSALFITCNDMVMQFCHGGLVGCNEKTKEKTFSATAVGKIWQKNSNPTYLSIKNNQKEHLYLNEFSFDNETNTGERGGMSIGRIDINETLKNQCLAAAFHGHQHWYYGLKLIAKYDYSKYQNPDYLAPWQAVTKPENIEQARKNMKIKGLPLKSDDYPPIFTFSTATHGLCGYDCIGLLHVGNTIDNCELRFVEQSVKKPYEEKCNAITCDKSKGLFTSIKLIGKDISVDWSNKPNQKPVEIEIKQKETEEKEENIKEETSTTKSHLNIPKKL